MNQFTAKKLGEVLAFTNIGLEILKQGKTALVKILGQNSVDALTKMNMEQVSNIQEIAEQKNMLSAVEQKAHGTEEKLRKMQALYLQDKWEDESELLEWLGFFEGAALVHWKLVEGVAQQSDDSFLSRLVNKGLTMHQALLFKVSEAIKRVGKHKALTA
ncbi:MAG: hypothetical protein KW793_00395 [Candidatus Doudnabacteria bacterium]|nr:hypothetical protein [Candidatus Doudnabacteria bacterium]